jgi:hypothetical protein
VRKRYNSSNLVLPLILILQLALLLRLSFGITIWYDEAWRIVFASTAPSAAALGRMLFVDGWPVPNSSIHLFAVRLIHLSLGYPASVFFLRGISILAGLATTALLWRALRASGAKTAGTILAVSLCAANSLTAYYFVAVKEHAVIAPLAIYFLFRVVASLESRTSPGTPALIAIVAANAISPIAMPPLLAGLALLSAAWLGARRSLRLDAGFIAAGGGLCAALAIARLISRSKLEMLAHDFLTSHGIAATYHGIYEGSSAGGAASILKAFGALSGFAQLAPPAQTLGISILGTLVLAGAYLRYRGKGLAGLGIVVGSVIAFHLIAGLTRARYFLWIPPVLYFLVAHLFSTQSRILKAVSIPLVLAVAALSLIDDYKMLASYREAIRVDRVIWNAGDKSFRPGSDVVLHVDGLTFFSHEVIAAETPKGVLPSSEFGAGSLMLHPDYPAIPRVPERFLWTDTRIAEFDGGAIWLCESWRRTDAIHARIRKRAFGGRVTEESYADTPVFWRRFARADGR